MLLPLVTGGSDRLNQARHRFPDRHFVTLPSRDTVPVHADSIREFGLRESETRPDPF